MVCPMRPWFSNSIEVIQFDPECRTPGQASVAAMVIAGPRAARRKPSPAPAKADGGGASEALLLHASASRRGSRPGFSRSPPSPWTGWSACGLFTEPVDSDAGEAAEEGVFAEAAQRRRIRRSVTANLGPGLPPHILPVGMASRIFSRRRWSGPSGMSLGAGGSADCSAAECVQRDRSGSPEGAREVV
ncbi:unnamed protein product [Prorocentrum cordatum]|uniref:Uncharacterized protein n=1 Tax=Prorocentrum cordatum TaxID=2364126 RepID=A0ABN9Y2B9_9DINO|nr:unnamed protein product [Polarella glacialis]